MRSQVKLRNSVKSLFEQVKERIDRAQSQGEQIDYLSFVPDGEPTLDTRLSETIDLLRPLGINIAIISNGSLIWRETVRETLKKADWVSLKVDTVDEKIWHHINQSHGKLKLNDILEGMLIFAQEYQGILASDTMLVKDINVSQTCAEGVADFLEKLHPQQAYLLVPTRPPAQKDIQAPPEEEVRRFYHIVSHKVPCLQCIAHYEGNTFTTTGDVATDVLSITAVHPMREEAIRELLAKTQSDWQVIQKLLDDNQLVETLYQGHRFYLRR